MIKYNFLAEGRTFIRQIYGSNHHDLVILSSLQWIHLFLINQTCMVYLFHGVSMSRGISRWQSHTQIRLRRKEVRN